MILNDRLLAAGVVGLVLVGPVLGRMAVAQNAGSQRVRPQREDTSVNRSRDAKRSDTRVNGPTAPVIGGPISGGGSAPAGSATDIAARITTEQPVLTQGEGGWNERAAASIIGDPDSRGYDCQAIARWDVVPFQTITGDLPIGVVAFHIAGIDRVEFSVDGGPAVPVRGISRNAASGAYEYTAVLRAADYRAGPIRVQAVAYPRVGRARVLETLVLNADPRGDSLGGVGKYVSEAGDDGSGDGGPERPFRTISKAAAAAEKAAGRGGADDCTIYLMPGEYALGTDGLDQRGAEVGYPTTREGFLTITAAPGITREEVRITSSVRHGLKTARLHLRHLSVVGTTINNSIPRGAEPVIWFDGCSLTTGDRAADIKWAQSVSWTGGIYVTDCTVTDAAWGWVAATLVRNTSLKGIGHDAFDNCAMLVNVSVDDLAPPPGSKGHPDILQYWATETPWDNAIVYGLRATNCQSQGFFFGYTHHVPGPAWSNIAMVNVLMEATLTAQWCVSARHVLWWHMTLPTSLVYVRDNPAPKGQAAAATTVTDMDMRDCVMQRFYLTSTGGSPSATDRAWAVSNHFIDTAKGVTPGAAWTRGGSLADLFVSPSSHDYRARRGSVIDGRTTDGAVVPDAANQPRPAAASLGALQTGE